MIRSYAHKQPAPAGLITVTHNGLLRQTKKEFSTTAAAVEWIKSLGKPGSTIIEVTPQADPGAEFAHERHRRMTERALGLGPREL